MTLGQDILNLIVGQQYEITYLVGNSAYVFPGLQNGSVSISGQVNNHASIGSGPISMVASSLMFTATATTETLLVTSRTPTTSYDSFMIKTKGPVIPEPSSWLLVGLGGVALVVKRRR